MIVRLSKFELPISRRMLAVSLLLHGALMCAVILYSYRGTLAKKPPQPTITPVEIVAVSEGVPEPHKLDPGPPQVPPAAPQSDLKAVAPIREEPPARPDLIEAKTIKRKKQPRIKTKRRKRPPRTVEAPKPEPQKQKPQPKEKKEDPGDLVEKRLDEIRKRLKEKSKNATSRPGLPDRPDRDPPTVDRELLLWFGKVRERINDHWAVVRGVSTEKRVASVGLELSRDGEVVKATVIRSSGDRLFDTSVLRAIFQSAPFPPIPPRVWEKIRKEGGLELRFNSGGLA